MNICIMKSSLKIIFNHYVECFKIILNYATNIEKKIKKNGTN